MIRGFLNTSTPAEREKASQARLFHDWPDPILRDNAMAWPIRRIGQMCHLFMPGKSSERRST
jgi:hypothetical protein